MRAKTLLLTLFMLLSHLYSTANIIDLAKEADAYQQSFTFVNDSNPQTFELVLEASKLQSSYLYLIFESSDKGFELWIKKPKSKPEDPDSFRVLSSTSGNILFIVSQAYLNSKLGFDDKSNSFAFEVHNKAMNDLEYSIKANVGRSSQLSFGRVYTSRIDSTIKEFNVTLHYEGTALEDVDKLRFQLTALKVKPNYSLNASMEHGGEGFLLNNIFYKTVGGMIRESKFGVCKEKDCAYDMSVKLSNIKVLNMSAYHFAKIERLAFDQEEYYDRLYGQGDVAYYELPYTSLLQGKDVVIGVTSVSQNCELFVNAKEKPELLEDYAYRTSSFSSLRLTVPWSELEQQQAAGQSLFIAVKPSLPGEFLLKVSAHDQGLSGILSPGVLEQGRVPSGDITQYLYQVRVFKTQAVSLQLTLQVTNGNGGMYLKQCEQGRECTVTESDLQDAGVSRVEGSNHIKKLNKEFNCLASDKKLKTCNFAIAVKGSSPEPCWYEIRVLEPHYHLLLVSGQTIDLVMEANERRYFKFSSPIFEQDHRLFLAVNNLYGNFSVYISKEHQFPDVDTASITQAFAHKSIGLFAGLKDIELTPGQFDDNSLQGHYYVTVVASTHAELHMKFHEFQSQAMALHSLPLNTQIQGELVANRVAYYTLQFGDAAKERALLTVSLTPLKGQYIMFANKGSKLPTEAENDFMSTNHHMEMDLVGMDPKVHECVVGVQLNGTEEQPDASYAYVISYRGQARSMKMNQGIISEYMIEENNVFHIDVHDDIEELLIIKSVVDGYNIRLCAKFATREQPAVSESDDCDYTADFQRVSLYLTKAQIAEHCDKLKAEQPESLCRVVLSVIGTQNQKFALGFTVNGLPFQLPKHFAVTGPLPTSATQSINFVYHAEESKAVGVYFNAKGYGLGCYTKLVSSKAFDNEQAIAFPSIDDSDKERSQTRGFITNVYYDEQSINASIQQPEVLIAIRQQPGAVVKSEGPGYFVLQVVSEVKEILRTQSFNDQLREQAWGYYTFYNNGNSGVIDIYASTTGLTALELVVAKGLQQRPPIKGVSLASGKGVGSVALRIAQADLEKNEALGKEKFKGHYTVGVKASSDCVVSMYWNNKVDLNYIEITPNEPATMVLAKDKLLYFSFYASNENELTPQAKTPGPTDSAQVVISFHSSVKAQVYMLKSSGDLDAPSEDTHKWQARIDQPGGIAMIRVRPDDEAYCIGCLYIGVIQASEEGRVSILANVKHNKLPLQLSPGLTFPEVLTPFETQVYRVHSPGDAIANIQVSMLHGQIDLFVSASSDQKELLEGKRQGVGGDKGIHGYIQVNPLAMNAQGQSDYYVLARNNGADQATFTLQLEEHERRSSINWGFTKFVLLSPSEAIDYVLAQPQDGDSFSLQLEVRQVLEAGLSEQVLASMSSVVQVYSEDEAQTRTSLSPTYQSVHNNRLLLTYETVKEEHSVYVVSLYNKFGSVIGLSVDAFSQKHKLISMNDFVYDAISAGQARRYEGYGYRHKEITLNAYMCKGEASYEVISGEGTGDQSEPSSKGVLSSKKGRVTSESIKLGSDKFVVNVQNNGSEETIFQMQVTAPDEVIAYPRNDVVQGNAGKVDVETENSLLRFQSVDLRAVQQPNYYYKLNYTAMIALDEDVLNYAKTCGDYLIDRAFESPHIRQYSFVEQIEPYDSVEPRELQLHIGGLQSNSKYFGTIAVQVELFPIEGGFLSPLWRARLEYDQFSFKTQKFQLPFNLIVSIVLLACLFTFAFYVVKAYVFGGIGKTGQFKQVKNVEADEGMIVGMNLISILEQEYAEGSKAKAKGKVGLSDVEVGEAKEVEMAAKSRKSD